jgi:predicted MFS family arabinose efflux permease
LLCLVASALPWGFEWLVLWRFVVGAAAGVMMIYSLAIVTRNAPLKRLGAATGVVFTGVGAGIFLAGAGVPVLLAGGLVTAWGGLAVIGALGVWAAFWGLGAADGQSRIGVAKPARVPWNGVSMRLAALQTLFAIGLIPHTIYWIDYQVRGLGHDMAFGGAQWALFGLGAVSGTYLWGRLADRIGFRVGLVVALAALATGVALPVVEPADWALVMSSLVVGAQPGFSAVLSGRAYQLVGVEHMAGVWRRVTLAGGVGQAIGGYVLVTMFTVTQSYTPVFLIAAAGLAIGAAIAWSLRAPS